jgi:predicted regulator of amino acid metabolism with ACT domain
MYQLLDVSSLLENFDLRKTANIVLMKSFSILEGILGGAERTSPNHVASAVLESSLKHLIPKEISPEVADYLSRNTLRSIVGLRPIEINTTDKDAIRKLKGSISWLSKEKIDITEIIREMREC